MAGMDGMDINKKPHRMTGGAISWHWSGYASITLHSCFTLFA